MYAINERKEAQYIELIDPLKDVEPWMEKTK